jgi:hypothetical protein
MAKTKKNEKKLSLNDIINYITGAQEYNPEFFLSQEKELKRNLKYFLEAIWDYPSLISFFNEYNLLYNDKMEKYPIEVLNYIKMIILEKKLSRWELKTKFFNFMEALNKVKELEDIAQKEGKQLIDIRAKKVLAQMLNKETQDLKIKKIDKKEIKSEIKDKVLEAIEKDKEIKKDLGTQKLKQSGKFLEKLDEEIVKDLELTIIDCYTTNEKIIYIFIDKDFKIRYFIEDFKYEFFISTESSVIENDYLVDYDPEKYIKYQVKNFWDYIRLRKAINDNYKKIIKA